MRTAPELSKCGGRLTSVGTVAVEALLPFLDEVVDCEGFRLARQLSGRSPWISSPGSTPRAGAIRMTLPRFGSAVPRSYLPMFVF